MNFSAKKILIIRLSSLGDIILTTPVIRALHEKFYELKIDFLCRKSFADVLTYNNRINKLFFYDDYTALTELTKVLQNQNYDAVIDLQNNFRSRKIISKLNIQKFIYHKLNFKKFLLVNFKINLLKQFKSISERYAESIPELQLDIKPAELFIPDNITSNLNSKNIVGFCPGSKHYTKMWLEEYFVELGNKLTSKGFRIALLGGKSDIEICSRISKKIKDAINLANQNKLLQTAADMKACKFIVCNDSGLMHTATAVGVPIVVLFGSTVKEFGFAPYKSDNLLLENNSLSCRPCSHIGRDNCRKNHFNCMRSLTPDLVFEQIQNFIEL